MGALCLLSFSLSVVRPRCVSTPSGPPWSGTIGGTTHHASSSWARTARVSPGLFRGSPGDTGHGGAQQFGRLRPVSTQGSHYVPVIVVKAVTRGRRWSGCLRARSECFRSRSGQVIRTSMYGHHAAALGGVAESIVALGRSRVALGKISPTLTL